MKTTLMLTAVVLMALILVPGCKKEPTQTETGTPAAPSSFTIDIDLEKTVADLKAEAAKMDVESLKAVAMKYKEAIAGKEAELKTLADKLSAIPLTEKMGKEAQALSADIKTLTDAVSTLKERFQVYLDALTAKGEDIKALIG